MGEPSLRSGADCLGKAHTPGASVRLLLVEEMVLLRHKEAFGLDNDRGAMSAQLLGDALRRTSRHHRGRVHASVEGCGVVREVIDRLEPLV